MLLDETIENNLKICTSTYTDLTVLRADNNEIPPKLKREGFGAEGIMKALANLEGTLEYDPIIIDRKKRHLVLYENLKSVQITVFKLNRLCIHYWGEQ